LETLVEMIKDALNENSTDAKYSLSVKVLKDYKERKCNKIIRKNKKEKKESHIS
jgi:hypothetical protein